MPLRRVIVLASTLVMMLLSSVARAEPAVRADFVQRSKLRLTFDPPPAPGEITIASEHALPIRLRADGRRSYTLPIVLRPRAPGSFPIDAGGRSATLDLGGVDPLPIARSLFSEDAYAPTAGEFAKLNDPTTRRSLVLAGMLVACALIGAALLRRGATITIVGLSATTTIGAVAWSASRPAVVERHAVVERTGQGNVKRDVWTWLIARRDVTVDWSPPTGQPMRLVPLSGDHLARLAPMLVVRADGSLESVRLTLKRGQQVALVVPDVSSTPEKIDPLDLAPLVRDAYRGHRVMTRSPGTWRVRATPE